MKHDLDGLAEIPILESKPNTAVDTDRWPPGQGLLFSVAVCGLFWGSVFLSLWLST